MTKNNNQQQLQAETAQEVLQDQEISVVNEPKRPMSKFEYHVHAF
jgi:hypothetical protein